MTAPVPAGTTLRGRLAGGDTALGTFVFEFGTSGIGRLAARAGAEFVVYDLEHSAFDWHVLRTLCATTSPLAVPLARVSTADRSYVCRALDQGCGGIMVPMVDGAATAEAIVAWSHYPPAGTRGAMFGSAHDDYALPDPARTMAAADDTTLVIAQIETADGLANADAIAAVDGVDVLWLGQFDLTASLGIPGQFDHPRFRAACRAVVESAERYGKTAGIMPTTVEEALDALRQGFHMLAYSADSWLYRAALADGLHRVRSAITPDLTRRPHAHGS